MAFEQHVVISIPSKGFWEAEFGESLVGAVAHMTRNLPNILLEMNSAHSSSLLDNRLNLVKLARETRPTHLFWADDDMVFPPDTIARLLRADKDIVGANCTSRKFPVIPYAVRDGRRVSSKGKTGLELVDQCGFGVVLVKMIVFDLIEKCYPEMPLFTFGWDRKRRETVSEDVFFFKQAGKAGFEAWVDHDLSNQVAHIGKVAFSHDMIPDEPAAAAE